MNKTQLIDAVAKEAGITKAESKKAVDAFVNVVSSALQSGDRIALVGFGSFSVAEKPARTGRNPRTGEAIEISAKKTVRFKAGVDLNANLK
mgnify:FL=1